MRIEIGAGTKGADGYLHVDAVEKAGVDVVDDGRYLRTFDDACAEEIYSHWFFEHVAHHEIPTMLAAWMRVLRPGGFISCVTNHQEAHNRCLATGEITWKEWTDLTYGIAGKRDYEIWDIHKSGWTEELLRVTLEEAGYVDIEVEAQWRCREADGRIKCPALIARASKPSG